MNCTVCDFKQATLTNFISLIYNFMPISYTCAVSNTTQELASYGQCADLAQEPLGPLVPCYIHYKWKCEMNLALPVPLCWDGTEQQWLGIMGSFESFFTRDGAIICKACSEISKNFLSLRAVMRILGCWVTIKLPSFSGDLKLLPMQKPTQNLETVLNILWLPGLSQVMRQYTHGRDLSRH